MMPKTKPKPRRTPEERRAQITELRERLGAWLDALPEVERDQVIAYHMARFDKYSQDNACLIAMQRPTATDVRGYVEWTRHGRRVRHGEHGIKILAPITKRDEDSEDGRLIGARVVYVFDITQTDPVETA